MGLKKWTKFILMYLRHWFWKIDKPHEKKKRFTPCEGCMADFKILRGDYE